MSCFQAILSHHHTLYCQDTLSQVSYLDSYLKLHRNKEFLLHLEQCPFYTEEQLPLSPFNLDSSLFPNERRFEIHYWCNLGLRVELQEFQVTLSQRHYESLVFCRYERTRDDISKPKVHQGSLISDKCMHLVSSQAHLHSYSNWYWCSQEINKEQLSKAQHSTHLKDYIVEEKTIHSFSIRCHQPLTNQSHHHHPIAFMSKDTHYADLWILAVCLELHPWASVWQVLPTWGVCLDELQFLWSCARCRALQDRSSEQGRVVLCYLRLSQLKVEQVSILCCKFHKWFELEKIWTVNALHSPNR